MEIDFGKEDVVLSSSGLTYNKNYKVSKDTFYNITKILNAFQIFDGNKLLYLGYADRTLINALRECGYEVRVIHMFKETIPEGFYEHKAKYFHEDDCYEGLPAHDFLLMDVPLEIYRDFNRSKVLLFGEADRKLYKKIILDKNQYKVNYKLEKALEFINLAKIDDVYLIDRIQTAVFENGLKEKIKNIICKYFIYS
jgi:hypothetical protein